MCDTIKKESMYLKRETCYLQDFGYERFEMIVEMIGGKWKEKYFKSACEDASTGEG